MIKCKLCEIEIKPYEPGTVFVESDDPDTDGVWHEVCLKQYREDYKTSDEVMDENSD